ncbi:pyrroline-5-carboxylate reductase [Kangiella sp. HZ709]|nr:pyrroline-5-carboxylate reductase [Kangiella sp. HZ709]
MAQAIIHGLIAADHSASQIICSNPSQGKLNALKLAYPDINSTTDNNKVFEVADIIILAVKPQMLSVALSSINTDLCADKLLISVAAGVETSTIYELLYSKGAIVRAMPNTPATIGEGVTGLFAKGNVSEIQRSYSEQIFNSVGQSVWIKQESQMDWVTAISGSGPAHYFYFLEAVIDSAVLHGFDPSTARQLAVQTAIGATKMAGANHDADISQLRQAVTSPGGTTAAAIESFQNDQFAEIINQALKASVKRGQELAQTSKAKQTTHK